MRIYGRVLSSAEIQTLSSYHRFDITTSANPEEGGSISGAGNYNPGETCTLNATANEGYTFMYWTENGEAVSTESTYSFIVTRERNLEAFFSPPLNITALANPSVSGTVSLSTDFENQQIPSNWTNDATYPWVITTPEYSGYNGSFCMMSGNGGVHSSTSSIEVTVDFIQDGSISFIAGCWGEGSSTIWDKCRFYIDDIEQFNYGAQQSWNSYYYEVPVGTHTFRWSYSKDGSVHPTGDAFFVDDVKFTGAGIGNQFNYGQTCTLTATPNEGYLFLNWNRNGEVLSWTSVEEIDHSDEIPQASQFIVTGDGVKNVYDLHTGHTDASAAKAYRQHWVLGANTATVTFDIFSPVGGTYEVVPQGATDKFTVTSVTGYPSGTIADPRVPGQTKTKVSFTVKANANATADDLLWFRTYVTSSAGVQYSLDSETQLYDVRGYHYFRTTDPLAH